MLDPPLPLVNVAPTLIHFPTLFEDNVVKYRLRRIQIVQYALDFIKSTSSFIEKVLWIIESKCQIHLGKVSITPLYKRERRERKKEQPQKHKQKLQNDSRVVIIRSWIKKTTSMSNSSLIITFLLIVVTVLVAALLSDVTNADVGQEEEVLSPARNNRFIDIPSITAPFAPVVTPIGPSVVVPTISRTISTPSILLPPPTPQATDLNDLTEINRKKFDSFHIFL